MSIIINPYLKKWLVSYEASLKLPIAAQLRAREATAVNKLIHRYIQSGDTVFEIGSGSGFYTKEILQITPHIVCLEESAIMTEELKKRFKKMNLKVPKIMTGRFPDVMPEKTFDHVIAIGVLDYIENPEEFIQAVLKVAQKSFIFTTVGGYAFGKLGQKMAKTLQVHIYCHTEKQLGLAAKPYKVKIERVTLAKPISAVTLVGVVNLKQK